MFETGTAGLAAEAGAAVAYEQPTLQQDDPKYQQELVAAQHEAVQQADLMEMYAKTAYDAMQNALSTGDYDTAAAMSQNYAQLSGNAAALRGAASGNLGQARAALAAYGAGGVNAAGIANMRSENYAAANGGGGYGYSTAAYTAAATYNSISYASQVAATGAMAATSYLVKEVAESWQNAETERAKADGTYTQSYDKVGNSDTESMYNSAITELDKKIAAASGEEKAALLEQKEALVAQKWETLQGHTEQSYQNWSSQHQETANALADLEHDPINDKLGEHVTGDNRKALSIINAGNVIERIERERNGETVEGISQADRDAYARWDREDRIDTIKEASSQLADERDRVQAADKERVASEIANVGQQANETSPGTGKEEGKGADAIARQPESQDVSPQAASESAAPAVAEQPVHTSASDTTATDSGESDQAARVQDVETAKSAAAQGIDPATVTGESARVDVAQQQPTETLETPASAGSPEGVETAQAEMAQSTQPPSNIEAARAQALQAVGKPAPQDPTGTAVAQQDASAMGDGQYHQMAASADHQATEQVAQAQTQGQQPQEYNRADFARMLVGSEMAGMLASLGVSGGQTVVANDVAPQQTYNSAYAAQQRYDAINQANGVA